MSVSRILMVSKFRKITGGVEQHIQTLAEGLESQGLTIEHFTSEDVQEAIPFAADARGVTRKATIAAKLLWNQPARNSFLAAVHRFQPDLIHYHSISHQLSPSILGAVSAPSVMTLHDYKLSAPCYTLVRDDQVCDQCVGLRWASPAVKYACVSNSRAKSALCAAESLIHKPRHLRSIDTFIVPSHFAANVARRAGIPSIRVIPWGVTVPSIKPQERKKRVVYAGRLHPTKGVQQLLDAWDLLKPGASGWELRILGDGDLMDLARERADTDPSITILGVVSSAEVHAELAAARLSVLPSVAPETMGLSALESLKLGTPLVVSGNGALQDLIGAGVISAGSSEFVPLSRALGDAIERADSLRTELAGRDLSMYDQARMITDIRAVYDETAASSTK